MLYHLFSSLVENISFFNVFKYLTVRSLLAAFTSMGIWFIWGEKFIALIKNYQIQQYIREEGPKSHQSKSGTPTMGGVLILFAAFVATLLWCDLTQDVIWLVVICGAFFGALGFHDDFTKIKNKSNQGLTAKQKFLGQIVISGVVGYYLWQSPNFNTSVYLPILKDVSVNLSYFYIPFVILVICGSSNAVNLTDGLDGLAIGPIAISAMAYMVLVYCSGNSMLSDYLQIQFVPGAAEVTVLLAGIVGAALGFLWYNTYPAQIFMGDVGSLSLGAILGLVALICKQELILIVIGGIFVMEALSVILQVFYFKLTGGRRIFRMAPLHHHFELKGWAEPKVIVRFWIVAAILALIGLATLKIR